MTGKVAYWQLPAAETRAAFATVIAELAERFNAPVFEPHVTLYSGPVLSENEAAKSLDIARQGRGPLCLEAI